MVDSSVSCRFPMFRLKNRRTFTLFTNYAVAPGQLVNWPKVRTNQFQGSEIRLKVGTRRNSFATYRFWRGIFKTRGGNLLCIFRMKNGVLLSDESECGNCVEPWAKLFL